MNLLSIKYKNKSDLFGALASALCLIHCVATPFLFLAQGYSASCCDSSPVWWEWIDYFFLLISFIAVYYSNQTTNKVWVGQLLWISWAILAAMILNEKLELLQIAEYIIYIPALALISLHLYSHRYCQYKL